MRSVTVTLSVIEHVARLGPIGVSELARQTALPKSTVQRALVTAADSGWLVAEITEPTRWIVAPRMASLFATSVVPDLRAAALPHLTALSETTGDAVHLVVRDQHDVVLLERVPGRHPVQVVVPVGFRVPLHAGATGKAILAALPPNEVDAAASPGGALTALTDRTVSTRDELRRQLVRIRRQGFATNEGEWDTSVVAVAAAIVDVDGTVHGAVSVSSTPSRLDVARRRALGPIVAATAAAIADEVRVRGR
jgi:IclR family transcriptional regulator, acetate operon repressor